MVAVSFICFLVRANYTISRLPNGCGTISHMPIGATALAPLHGSWFLVRVPACRRCGGTADTGLPCTFVDLRTNMGWLAPLRVHCFGYGCSGAVSSFPIHVTTRSSPRTRPFPAHRTASESLRPIDGQSWLTQRRPRQSPRSPEAPASTTIRQAAWPHREALPLC